MVAANAFIDIITLYGGFEFLSRENTKWRDIKRGLTLYMENYERLGSLASNSKNPKAQMRAIKKEVC